MTENPISEYIDHAERAAFTGEAEPVPGALRARIEADVLRRVAEEGPVHFAMTHRQPQFRGMNVVDPAWLRAEADRIEREGHL